MWYRFSICLQKSYFIRHPSSPVLYLIRLPVYLSSMVKAYSMGTSICHTTNILNYCLFYTVQWIKPPFKQLFPDILLDSLSRQECFLDFFWIGYMISLPLLFVNTIFDFICKKNYNILFRLKLSDFYILFLKFIQFRKLQIKPNVNPCYIIVDNRRRFFYTFSSALYIEN